MRFSTTFKEAIVKQALQSSDPRKLVAQNAGIGYSTLQKWLRQYRQSTDQPVPTKEKRPQDWSAEERLNALIESANMGAQEKAAWCRQKRPLQSSPGAMAKRDACRQGCRRVHENPR